MLFELLKDRATTVRLFVKDRHGESIPPKALLHQERPEPHQRGVDTRRLRLFELEIFLSFETALVGQRSNPGVDWWKLEELLSR
jgi:hypothetical protein